MIADSRSDAGATIVSGSQAHQPHTLEFMGIVLFTMDWEISFDRWVGLRTQQDFSRPPHFYNGNYLGVIDHCAVLQLVNSNAQTPSPGGSAPAFVC